MIGVHPIVLEISVPITSVSVAEQVAIIIVIKTWQDVYCNSVNSTIVKITQNNINVFRKNCVLFLKFANPIGMLGLISFFATFWRVCPFKMTIFYMNVTHNCHQKLRLHKDCEPT